MVDVDGSYLYQKYHQAGILAAVPIPEPPPAGWVSITKANYHEHASKVPRVTHGKSSSIKKKETRYDVIDFAYTRLALYLPG